MDSDWNQLVMIAQCRVDRHVTVTISIYQSFSKTFPLGWRMQTRGNGLSLAI